MWWKIYFGIALVFNILGFMDLIPQLSKFSVGDWISYFSGLILLAGVYSFSFAKRIMSAQNWKLAFWFLITWVALGVVIDLDSSGNLKNLFRFLDLRAFNIPPPNDWTVIPLLIFALLFTLPGLYTVYRLAYKNKKK